MRETTNLITGSFWFDRTHSTLPIGALSMGKINQDPDPITFKLYSNARGNDNSLTAVRMPAGSSTSPLTCPRGRHRPALS